MKYMYLVIAFIDYTYKGAPMAVSTANDIFYFPSPCIFETEEEAQTLCHKMKLDGVLSTIRKVEVGSYSKKTMKEIYARKK